MQNNLKFFEQALSGGGMNSMRTKLNVNKRDVYSEIDQIVEGYSALTPKV